MTNRRRLPLLLLSLLALWGCGGSKPQDGPPPPPPAPLLVAIPQAPLSSLRIPVQVDLDFVTQKALASLPRPLVRDTLRRKVQISLPGGLYSPAVGVAFRHQAEIEGLDLRLNGDSLVAVARVGFRVGSALEGGSLSMGVASCGEKPGEQPAGIEFTLRGKIAWGADGKVLFVPRPWTLRWTRPCELTAFKIRLEDVLDLPLVRQQMGKAIDAAIEKMPESIQVRLIAEKAWKELGKPRQVWPGMFLAVRPESLKLAPLRGNGKTLTTAIILLARPMVGADSTVPVAPLPRLRVDAAPDRGFRLDLQAALPLPLVDSSISRILRATPIQAEGRTVRMTAARLYGGGDKAVIAVTFAEPFEGEVFLRGVPQFDSAANAVRFAGLDFDLASRSFLLRSAAFLLHGTIRDAIAKSAVVPLDAALRPLSSLKIPVGDGVVADIGVGRIRPLGISIGDSTLQAWVRAEGRAAVAVGPSGP